MLRSRFFLLVVSVLSLGAARVLAQTETPTPSETSSATPAATPADADTLTTEGVSGDMDKKRRDPTLSVRTENTDAGVRILVDAYVASPDYEKYPLQFDFYINRRLFTTQIRSTELPGAVGVDIGPDVATPPFNYTVVASVLHPNRKFTTVLNGAVFKSNLRTTFDCTLTTGSLADKTSVDYVANSVTTSQVSNEQFSISFETTSVAGDTTVSLSSAVTVGEKDAANATLSITKDGTQSDIETSGTVTIEGTEVKAITLSSSDGDTELKCE